MTHIFLRARVTVSSKIIEPARSFATVGAAENTDAQSIFFGKSPASGRIALSLSPHPGKMSAIAAP